MDEVSDFFIMIMKEHNQPTASSAWLSHTFPCCFCIYSRVLFKVGLNRLCLRPCKSVQAADDCYLSKLCEKSASPSILVLLPSSRAATT